MNYIEIVKEAAVAAERAVAIAMIEHGDEGAAGYAWVEIAKGPAVVHLIAAGLEKGCGEAFHRGAVAYRPGKPRVQSIEVHEAGARAFADVLTSHGIAARHWSRRD